MKLADLLVLYGVVGGACAFALYRRAATKNRAALWSALIAVPLWPLWAPIAWTAERARPRPEGHASERVERIRAALADGVQSVDGTALQTLLNAESARTIVHEVERLAARHAELSALLLGDEFDLELARKKLEQLERHGGSARLQASARLHLENVRRLHHLAERDGAALDELTGLAVALRTQLLLVRLSGSSAEGIGDIVSELWARLESLREASDVVSPAPSFTETAA